MQPFSVDSFRALFPALTRKVNGRQVCYLDSAATSLKPTCVINAEREYEENYSANIHRGRHTLSEEATAAFEAARRQMARYLGSSPERTVFTQNATHALNLVACGLPSLQNTIVLVPECEHHSTSLPWVRRANVVFLPDDPRGPLQIDEVVRVLTAERPSVLCLSHASHLTGRITDVAEIAAAARAVGTLTVLDASQSAAHGPLDFAKLGCDFVVVSGHKMFGPTGTGVLTGRPELMTCLEPLMIGGGVVESVKGHQYTLKPLPGRLEAGTPNISGVIGLGKAAAFIQEFDAQKIQAHLAELRDALKNGLSEVRQIEVFHASSANALPTATIASRNSAIDFDQVAILLANQYGVMARSGTHCAHTFAQKYTSGRSTIRVSAGIYNSKSEIDLFCGSIQEVLSFFG